MYYLAIAIFIAPLAAIVVLYFVRRRMGREAEQHAYMPREASATDDQKLEAPAFAGREDRPRGALRWFFDHLFMVDRPDDTPIEAGDIDDHMLEASALAAREQRRPRTMQWLFEYFAIVGRNIWWR